VDESLNYREFKNVIDMLEEEAKQGNLRGTVIFLCTDTGNSSSKKLFDLVHGFWTLEIREGIQILVLHVSGKRMKTEGMDGTSRGQLREGVTVGEDLLGFIPCSSSRSNPVPSTLAEILDG
jgi:hypothetical protein